MAFDPQTVLRRMLVSPSGMAEADERTIASGTERAVLVRRAAQAVVRVVRSRFPRQPTVILCGPGQNGEDGLVTAEFLLEAGWPVEVLLLDETRDLEDRSALLPHLRPTGSFSPRNGMLVIDALFGAGLSRDLEGEALMLAERLELSKANCLAVDLPSGLDAATGEVLGGAPVADVTVTFHRMKPGHLLGAGRERCGRLILADIGITPELSDAHALHNDPGLWRHRLTGHAADTHKYEKGHVAVVGGPGLKGGAGRLSARGAAVSGAGAVTFLTPLSAAEFAAHRFDAVMVAALEDTETLTALVKKRGGSVVLGPGMGHGDRARALLDAVLAMKVPTVLDADAITLFEDRPQELFSRLHESCVLTPHEGEFRRLFGDVEGDKIRRTAEAAEKAGAAVLLKGSTTVIAGGDLPVVNTNGSPVLATAGSGDVLAGLIGGFLAQGLSAPEAAAAGAWVHGEAAQGAGSGFTADGLPGRIAGTLRRLTTLD